MKVIFKELLASIRASKLNTKGVKIAAALSIVVLVAILIKTLLFPAVETGTVGSEADFDEMIELVDVVKNGQDGEGVTAQSTEQIETTILLFFSAMNDRSLDLFSSAYDPYQIQNDFILKFPIEELEGKYNEAMDRISRNGQIESVEIVNSTRMLNLSKFRVVVDIHYKDLSAPIRASVQVQTVEEHEQHSEASAESHEEVSYKQPYITSSVWDLIDLIESGVK